MRGGSRPAVWRRVSTLALVVLAAMACSSDDLASLPEEGVPSEARWTAGAMDTEQRSEPGEENAEEASSPEASRSEARNRAGSSGSTAMNEIGLIPFLLPTTEGEVYAADCEFSDDPYSACL